MSKVIGIKSVDFKIEASGNGVVNWNGTSTVRVEGSFRNNHALPKLRGFSNVSQDKDKNDKFMPVDVTDIDLKKTPVYISQNCIKHHLFKEESFNMTSDIKSSDAHKLLCSAIGLLRGYAIPAAVPLMRKSPLLIGDFIEVLGNGNFEQMGKSGSRDQTTTMFSRTTMGDTKYVGYGSLSIEDLSFISLDNIFGRAAVDAPISPKEGDDLAKKITDYLKTLDFDSQFEPIAIFDQCYVRNGSVMDLGEAGIVLNSDAIQLVVNMLIEKLKNLSIKQGKGWMQVDKVIIDYNSSNKAMRITKDENAVNDQPETSYASFYRKGDKVELEKSLMMKNQQEDNKGKKSKKKE